MKKEQTTYTVKEAAILLGIAPISVRRLVEQKKLIPCGLKKVGRYGTDIFTADELDRYLNKKPIVNIKDAMAIDRSVYDAMTEQEKDDLDLILNLIDKAFPERFLSKKQQVFLKRVFGRMVDCDRQYFTKFANKSAS